MYPKYPHYGVFLLAPFAGIFVWWLGSMRAGKLAAGGLVAAVFLSGVGSWAYSGWGHAAPDSTLANVRYLSPGYGDALERLGRSSVRSPESLRDEISEHTNAISTLGPEERILYADVEPGALVPSILDREFLGDVDYLEGESAALIRAAETDAELQRRLAELEVRYVYRPRGTDEWLRRTLIGRRIEGYRGTADHLIGVGSLLRGPTEPSRASRSPAVAR